jgi:cytochrome c-type biogenesis protein CcmH/NrfG
LREKGDFQSAANELRLAVAELPDDPEGHQLLRTVLLKMNDLPDAVESFEKALRLAPSLADAHATLAQALQRTGRKEEAKKNWQT